MLRNLISYVKDNDYLIGIYNNKVYIYNYKKIINIDNNYIKIDLGSKKIKIKGKNLSVKKLENNEILININTEGLEIYEWKNKS